METELTSGRRKRENNPMHSRRPQRDQRLRYWQPVTSEPAAPKPRF